MPRRLKNEKPPPAKFGASKMASKPRAVRSRGFASPLA